MAAADKVMEMVLGATMTQVALCRFLVREKVIDQDRLLAFFEERGKSWGKTASDEALLPLVAVVAALSSKEEPPFPSTFH